MGGYTYTYRNKLTKSPPAPMPRDKDAATTATMSDMKATGIFSLESMLLATGRGCFRSVCGRKDGRMNHVQREVCKNGLIMARGRSQTSFCKL